MTSPEPHMHCNKHVPLSFYISLLQGFCDGSFDELIILGDRMQEDQQWGTSRHWDFSCNISFLYRSLNLCVMCSPFYFVVTLAWVFLLINVLIDWFSICPDWQTLTTLLMALPPELRVCLSLIKHLFNEWIDAYRVDIPGTIRSGDWEKEAVIEAKSSWRQSSLA